MLFINFLCLLYLMILIDSHTISKSIENDEVNDIFDTINDLDHTRRFRHRRDRLLHKYKRDDKYEVTTPQSKVAGKISTAITTLTSEHLKHHKSPKSKIGGFWRKFKAKGKKKGTDIKERQRRNPKNRNYRRTFANNVTDYQDYGLKINKRRRNINQFVLRLPSAIVKREADKKNANEISQGVTTLSHHKENSNFINQLASQTQFRETAQIEELLNNIKSKTLKTIAQQNPAITEIITNTVTEATFDADPFLNHIYMTVPAPNIFGNPVSINNIRSLIEKRTVPTTEGNVINFTDSIPITNSEPYVRSERSIKEDTMTIAHSVEDMLQRELKNIYHKVKNKVSNDIPEKVDKIKTTVKQTTSEIAEKISKAFKPTPTKPAKPTTNTVSFKTSTTPSTKELITPAITKLEHKENKKADVERSPSPTYDDYMMISLVEKMLAKTQRENTIQMLSTEDLPFKKRRSIQNKLSKRNAVTLSDLELKKENKIELNNEHGINKRDYDYVEPNGNGIFHKLSSEVSLATISSTDRMEIEELLEADSEDSNFDESAVNEGVSVGDEENLDLSSVTADPDIGVTSLADTTFEGLSEKICYNDFVNGYKHYLNFQKEQGDQKFSALVRYQAHRHHKVDDIGKYILNKIPQFRKKRFFDDTDINDQEISTKTDDSWFKKHFYFFIDNGPPKKFHNSQTVTLKSPKTEAGPYISTAEYVAMPRIKDQVSMKNSLINEPTVISTLLKQSNLDTDNDQLNKVLASYNILQSGTTPAMENNLHMNMIDVDNMAGYSKQPVIYEDNIFGNKLTHTLKTNQLNPYNSVSEESLGLHTIQETGRFRRAPIDGGTDKLFNNELENKEIESLTLATAKDEHDILTNNKKDKQKRSKDGYVDVKIVPTTKVGNLRENVTNRNRFKNFFKIFNFHKTKIKDDKKKHKRESEIQYQNRIRRYNYLKKLRDMFGRNSKDDEHVKQKSPAIIDFKLNDYDLVTTSHFDTFKAKKYDKPMSIKDMEQEIPNISDTVAEDFKTSTTTTKAYSLKLDDQDRSLLQNSPQFGLPLATPKPSLTIDKTTAIEPTTSIRDIKQQISNTNDEINDDYITAVTAEKADSLKVDDHDSYLPNDRPNFEFSLTPMPALNIDTTMVNEPIMDFEETIQQTPSISDEINRDSMFLKTTMKSYSLKLDDQNRYLEHHSPTFDFSPSTPKTTSTAKEPSLNLEETKEEIFNVSDETIDNFMNAMTSKKTYLLNSNDLFRDSPKTDFSLTTRNPLSMLNKSKVPILSLKDIKQQIPNISAEINDNFMTAITTKKDDILKLQYEALDSDLSMITPKSTLMTDTIKVKQPLLSVEEAEQQTSNNNNEINQLLNVQTTNKAYSLKFDDHERYLLHDPPTFDDHERYLLHDAPKFDFPLTSTKQSSIIDIITAKEFFSMKEAKQQIQKVNDVASDDLMTAETTTDAHSLKLDDNDRHFLEDLPKFDFPLAPKPALMNTEKKKHDKFVASEKMSDGYKELKKIKDAYSLELDESDRHWLNDSLKLDIPLVTPTPAVTMESSTAKPSTLTSSATTALRERSKTTQKPNKTTTITRTEKYSQSTEVKQKTTVKDDGLIGENIINVNVKKLGKQPNIETWNKEKIQSKTIKSLVPEIEDMLTLKLHENKMKSSQLQQNPMIALRQRKTKTKTAATTPKMTFPPIVTLEDMGRELDRIQQKLAKARTFPKTSSFLGQQQGSNPPNVNIAAKNRKNLENLTIQSKLTRLAKFPISRIGAYAQQMDDDEDYNSMHGESLFDTEEVTDKNAPTHYERAPTKNNQKMYLKKNSEHNGKKIIYTDYFNDLLTWHNDVLNLDKVPNSVWKTILKSMQAESGEYTTHDTANLTNEIDELKTILEKSSKRYLKLNKLPQDARAKKDGIIRSVMMDEKAVVTSDDFLIKGEAKYFEYKKPPTQDLKINERDLKTNGFASTLGQLLHKDHYGVPGYRSDPVVTTDAQAILMDTSLLAYDDEVETITDTLGLKKQSRNSQTLIPIINYKAPTLCPIAKTNKQPVQHYATPFPMKTYDFEKFLKDYDLDVESVTAPMMELPSMPGTWDLMKKSRLFVTTTKYSEKSSTKSKAISTEKSIKDIKITPKQKLPNKLKDTKNINENTTKYRLPIVLGTTLDYKIPFNEYLRHKRSGYSKNQDSNRQKKRFRLFDKKDAISTENPIQPKRETRYTTPTLNPRSDVDITIINFDDIENMNTKQQISDITAISNYMKDGNENTVTSLSDVTVTETTPTLDSVDTVQKEYEVTEPTINALLFNNNEKDSFSPNIDFTYGSMKSTTETTPATELSSEADTMTHPINGIPPLDILYKIPHGKNFNSPQRVQISSHHYKYDIFYNEEKKKKNQEAEARRNQFSSMETTPILFESANVKRSNDIFRENQEIPANTKAVRDVRRNILDAKLKKQESTPTATLKETQPKKSADPPKEAQASNVYDLKSQNPQYLKAKGRGKRRFKLMPNFKNMFKVYAQTTASTKKASQQKREDILEDEGGFIFTVEAPPGPMFRKYRPMTMKSPAPHEQKCYSLPFEIQGHPTGKYLSSRTSTTQDFLSHHFAFKSNSNPDPKKHVFDLGSHFQINSDKIGADNDFMFNTPATTHEDFLLHNIAFKPKTYKPDTYKNIELPKFTFKGSPNQNNNIFDFGSHFQMDPVTIGTDSAYTFTTPSGTPEDFLSQNAIFKSNPDQNSDQNEKGIDLGSHIQIKPFTFGVDKDSVFTTQFNTQKDSLSHNFEFNTDPDQNDISIDFGSHVQINPATVAVDKDSILKNSMDINNFLKAFNIATNNDIDSQTGNKDYIVGGADYVSPPMFKLDYKVYPETTRSDRNDKFSGVNPNFNYLNVLYPKMFKANMRPSLTPQGKRHNEALYHKPELDEDLMLYDKQNMVGLGKSTLNRKAIKFQVTIPHINVKRDIAPNTFTAKDVAALEVIVDLMRNTLSYEEKDIASVFNNPLYVQKPATKSVGLINESTNAIQVHIAIPVDFQNGKKRSPLEQVRVRKVFSAKMFTPVDLEYQVHSIESSEAVTSAPSLHLITKIGTDDGLSPGMYLLIDKPKNGYALKPLHVDLTDLRARRSSTPPSEEKTKSLAKVTLSKEFISAVNQELVDLYENLTRSRKDASRKARQATTPLFPEEHNIENDKEEIGVKRHEYIHKRKINWEAVKKYFGHDRVCSCKCKPDKAMCRACAASDAVVDELIFEFNNLGQYMNEHCTEIQTYFWMNPSGGQKLRDAVERVDKSLHDYYKRVKGKCKGRTCNAFGKRDIVNTLKVVEEDAVTNIIKGLNDLADDLNKGAEFVCNFNIKLKEQGDKMMQALHNCVSKKTNQKRSYVTPKHRVKNVYSLDNINVNIICSPEGTDNSLNALHVSPIISSFNTIRKTTSTDSTAAVDLIDNLFDYDAIIKKSQKKCKGFRNFFRRNRMDKLFTYYVTEKPNKTRIQRKRFIDNEAPLISDSGGAFWYDYLKGNTLEPRLVREIQKEAPQINISVIETKNVTDDVPIIEPNNANTEFITKPSSANKNVSLETNKKSLLPRDVDTSTEYINQDESLSKNINQFLNLFGSIQDIETMNKESNRSTLFLGDKELQSAVNPKEFTTVKEKTEATATTGTEKNSMQHASITTVPKKTETTLTETTIPYKTNELSSTTKTSHYFPYNFTPTTSSKTTVTETIATETTMTEKTATETSTIETAAIETAATETGATESGATETAAIETASKEIADIETAGTDIPLSETADLTDISQSDLNSVSQSDLSSASDTTSDVSSISDSTSDSSSNSPEMTLESTTLPFFIPKSSTVETTHIDIPASSPEVVSISRPFKSAFPVIMSKKTTQKGIMDRLKAVTFKFLDNIGISEPDKDKKKKQNHVLIPARQSTEGRRGRDLSTEQVLLTENLIDESYNISSDNPTIVIIDGNEQMANDLLNGNSDKLKNLLLSIIQYETDRLNNEWEQVAHGKELDGIKKRSSESPELVSSGPEPNKSDQSIREYDIVQTLRMIQSPEPDNVSKKPTSLLNKLVSKIGIKTAPKKEVKQHDSTPVNKTIPNKKKLFFKLKKRNSKQKATTDVTSTRTRTPEACDYHQASITSQAKKSEQLAKNISHLQIVDLPTRNTSKGLSRKLHTMITRQPQICNLHTKNAYQPRVCKHSKNVLPPQICDLEATFQHTTDLYEKILPSTFENYVKNVSCHKYRRLNRNLVINCNKEEKRRWDWIRSKRSVNHFIRLKNKEVENDDLVEDRFDVATFNGDDQFEKFVRGDNGIYKIVNRKKRTAGLKKDLGLRNMPPLQPAENEVYVMLGDSISLNCLSHKPFRSDGEYTWNADRKGLLQHDNIQFKGVRVFIRNAAPKNVGNYVCSRDKTLRRNIKVTVVTLPSFDVVFLPLYNMSRDCTYDDLKFIQLLGPMMADEIRCGKLCSIRIDEPVCEKDRITNTSLIRAAAVLTVHPYLVNCSVQCRRDMLASFVMLCAQNVPLVADVEVILIKDNETEILQPRKDTARTMITRSLRKKDSNGHHEYRKLASLLTPGKVNVVLRCPAGYYLMKDQKICVSCPPNTSSSRGDKCTSGPERGAHTRRDNTYRLRRYDWWWYPPCGYVVACCSVCCACGVCVAFALLIQLSSRTDAVQDSGACGSAPKRSSAAYALRGRARPLSPSRVILARFFKPSLTSSRATDSQETKFELWKERNRPPPLPPIDFDS